MIDDYSESSLIELPAIEIFEKELGYEAANCIYETFGLGGTLGRDTSSEVVLVSRLRNSLARLNPTVPAQSIEFAVEELIRDRSSLNTVVANHEVYQLIKDGIRVLVRLPDGNEEVEKVSVIDFENPENNDFFLAQQFWISGEMYKRRVDLLGFVNGLPLVLVELKATHKNLKTAYQDNLTDYRDTIPQVFWYNAFIVLSNGSESRIGTITADWEHFSEWKKINSEGEEGVVSLETVIKGVCDKRRFLDILENFILYQGIKGSTGAPVKILAKNHQYLGVNGTVESFARIKENQGKLGVFWHTQGAGKSFSMIFFSQKILRKFPGNYTFLVVTDRKELDDQIYKNFLSTGAVTEVEVHAESGEHLRQLLREDHRNIFTLIHKFWTENGKPYAVLSERSDIIVMTDEAHRTQYDELAKNMRSALPNAAFIAFTGTPLIVGEELTRKTFGDYVSIYNFKQSVDDGATVPLYYENRIPELQLENKDLDEDLERIVEDAELTEEQREKLEREFAREYHLITRNDRLEKIAEDIVSHFVGRGYQGKAMVVSVDKPTAVKMYDKVQRHWAEHLERLKDSLRGADREDREVIAAKMKFMEETDMAVVVSSEQNEVKKFRELGLDIAKHRKRMVSQDLATKFKDPDDPFRIVFVCAMWMTGFDVQCLSTIYLDKPMRNHTLMQAIARANRVFRDKPNGLIVDYVGVFRDLRKALAIYGSGSGGGIGEGDMPVKPKSELVEELEADIKETSAFCEERGIDLERMLKAEKLERIKLLIDAVDAILVNDESKKKFLSLSAHVIKLYKAILPDPEAGKFTDVVTLFKVISEKIKSKSPEVDILRVMGQVEKLLDDSVAAEAYVIKEAPTASTYVDLSKINFEVLRKQFVEGRKHVEAERLKNAVEEKLGTMILQNRTRLSFQEKFQQLIDEYNSGAINVEVFFDNLMAFAQELDEESKRAISENLSEEELALFDLLYKPDLKTREVGQIKVMAKNLLEVLKKEKLVLDWRKRQQTRADVLLTIRTVLDAELPRSYGPPIYDQLCDLIYRHIYDSYFGAGESIYSGPRFGA